MHRTAFASGALSPIRIEAKS